MLSQKPGTGKMSLITSSGCSPLFHSSDKVNKPSFMKINRNITVREGETAYLPCRVKNLNDYTVH